MVVVALLAGCAGAPPEPEPGPVFYPEPPQQPRVQFLTTISSEKDIGGGRSQFVEFVAGTPEIVKGISRAYDVAHYADRLYVVDKGINAVHVIDLTERTFERMRAGRGGRLRNPLGIHVDAQGLVYVADKDRGQVVVFDQTNEYVRAYGEQDQFEPTDVAVHGGRVYVCDIRDEEIEILDQGTGALIANFGGQGNETGKFRFPSHLTVDAAGNVYVTDFMNFRVQIFDRDGRFLRTFGQVGDGPGDMPRPKGLAIDRDEHLYVVDAGFELVQIFDAQTGRALLGFGKYSDEPGATYLPQGVHVDYDNLAFFAEHVDPEFQPEYVIYVANQAGNHSINVYAFGRGVGWGS
jgi:sugar lactone lactonase YvrE